MRRSQTRPARAWMAVAALVALLPAGCYHIRPPYNREIKTVYLPIFKSQTFRRDQQMELTEMLKEEIQRRTPYIVVGTPEGADSTLEGTINYSDKNIAVESPNNLPRQLQAVLVAVVKWTDNRLPVEQTKDIQPMFVFETVNFYDEVGETAQLGFHKAMERMVRQIVTSMEQPWDEKTGALISP
ncbi:MAG: LptE family protein [Isosphaeraceae bacterium]|nr:LptE family protein [Isosphaeraceae bacterium]